MRSRFVFVLSLVFSLSAVGVRSWAQLGLPAPAQAAVPGTGEVPLVQEPEMVSADTIQFPNNPVSDFLVVYEKLKGVTLIKDASLLGGGANLSLTLNQPVTKAEAIRLLESTLLLNGYVFIALDKNAVKVINTAGGKNPRSEGVFLFTNESELPEGEVVASYVMPLTHLAATLANCAMVAADCIKGVLVVITLLPPPTELTPEVESPVNLCRTLTAKESPLATSN